MSVAKSNEFWAGVVLCVMLSAFNSGCGRSSPTIQAAPLKDRDAIAKALPKGVTLECPVVPDVMYGSSSRTVEEALASLQAYVRDNVIHDGGLGREIRFQPEGSKDAKSANKSRKKARTSQTVIVLSKSGG
jgi:hypothetical protein